MLQHPAPQQVEELVWAVSPPVSPHAGGPTPAQPTGHLALAGPECTGLCRRNAASVFPALAGQSFPGILPVGRGGGDIRGVTGPPESQPSEDDPSPTKRQTPVPVLPPDKSHHLPLLPFPHRQNACDSKVNSRALVRVGPVVGAQKNGLGITEGQTEQSRRAFVSRKPGLESLAPALACYSGQVQSSASVSLSVQWGREESQFACAVRRID